MLPANITTVPSVPDVFLSPNYEQYYKLKQTVLGGVALGDSSLGRATDRWTVRYSNNFIHVGKENSVDVFSLLAVGVTSVGLAFDASMRIVLTWTTLTGAKLYYYDTSSSDYITRDFPGVISSRVAADCIEVYYQELTDVIFAYTLNGNLYYRQQRDNYNIERLVGACDKYLIRLGPSANKRLQFKLVSDLDMIGESVISPVPIMLNGPEQVTIPNPDFVQPTVENYPVFVSTLGHTLINQTINQYPIKLTELANALLQNSIDSYPIHLTEKFHTMINQTGDLYSVNLSRVI